MLKVTGEHNYLNNAVESIVRGYDRVEPSFVKEAQKIKDAPIDKFIRYSKNIISKSETKNNNIFKKILSFFKKIK